MAGMHSTRVLLLGLRCIVLVVSCVHAAASNNPAYALTTRNSISGNDIDCGQTDYQGNAQSFCSISGGVTAVADACDANPACTSFVMQGSYSGYLKKGGTPVYTEGYNTFCRIGTKGCTGPYTMLRRTDIKGADINCNYKDYNGVAHDYCEVSGDLSAMVSACNDNPVCKALVVESDYTGYLKAASISGGEGPVREGYVTFVKVG